MDTNTIRQGDVEQRDIDVGNDLFDNRQEVEATLHAVDEGIDQMEGILSSWGHSAIKSPRSAVTDT